MNKIKKKILENAFIVNWKKNLKKHPMKWLEIEVTRRCPFDCLHCGSSCSMQSPYEEELSMDEILSACKKVADAYGAENVKVAITGGEPLARRDIHHLVARITEMGFRASLVTNGYLINEKNLKLIRASGIQSMSISIDGLKENHDWLRNKKGAFEQTVKAIKMVVDSGLFYIEPLTTLHSKNIDELPELEKLLIDLGVNSWRLGKVFPIGRANEYPELFLSSSQYKQMLDFIKVRYNDKKRKMPVSFCEEGYLGDEYEMEVRNYFNQCQAGVNICTILADGSLTGCAALEGGFIQGNIKSDDIVDVWENRYREFRDLSWKQQGACGKCEQWEVCMGDAMHLWTKGGKNPAVCHYQMLKHAK